MNNKVIQFVFILIYIPLIIYIGSISVPFLEYNLELLLLFIFTVFLVDLTSSCLHIFLDNYKHTELMKLKKYEVIHAEKLPIEEQKKLNYITKLSFEFQIHHEFPDTILKETYTTHLKTTLYPILIFSLLTVFLLNYNLDPKYIFCFLIYNLMTLNLPKFHELLHKENKALKILRSLKILGSYKTHLEHHKNHNHKNIHHINYSVINDWSNFMTNILIKLINKIQKI